MTGILLTLLHITLLGIGIYFGYKHVEKQEIKEAKRREIERKIQSDLWMDNLRINHPDIYQAIKDQETEE